MTDTPQTDRTIRRVGRRLRKLETSQARAARASQAGQRSVEDGDSIPFYDENGDLRVLIGATADDPAAFGVQTFGGVAPAVPSTPTVTPGPGTVTIGWDGYDADGLQSWGVDFERVEVHLFTAADYNPDDSTQVATFSSPAGGAVALNLPIGAPRYAKLVAVKTSGVESAATASVAAVAEPVELSPPIAPPASSPAVVATGMPTTIVLRADEVAATDLIEYHVSTVQGFTPSPATLLPNTPTRSQVYVAKNLPDGTAFVVDTPYYFRAVATNDAVDVDHPAPAPSAESTGRLDLTAIANLIASTLVVEIVTAALVNVGPAQFDADLGLIIPQSDGVSVIRLPVNINQDATIPNLATRRFLSEVSATLGGATKITGTATATAGTPNPAVGPSVGSDQEYLRLLDSEALTPNLYGLTQDATGRWVTVYALNPGSASLLVYTAAGELLIGVGSIPNIGAYILDGGVTRYGASLYVLGRRTDTRQIRWWKFNATTFAYEGQTGLTLPGGAAATTPLAVRPAIGTDPVNGEILVVSAQSATVFQVDAFDPATGVVGFGSATMANPYGVNAVGGIYSGTSSAAELAGAQYVIAPASNNFTAYDAAGTRAPTRDWPRAATSAVRGLFFDGTRFWHLDGNGYIRKYATGHPVTAAVDVTYTNYDAVSTTASYAALVAAGAPTWWARLNEAAGAGTMVDASGNGRDGTHTGVTTGDPGALGASGDASTAATYTGLSSSHSDIPYAAWMYGPTYTQITMTAWIKTNVTTGTRHVVSRAGANYVYALRVVGTLADFTIQLGGSTFVSAQSTATVADNAWHHVVGTWDGTSVRLYVDGALVATTGGAVGTLNNNVTNGLQVGGRGGLYFAGSVDEPAFYPTALAGSDAAALYTAGTSAAGANTVHETGVSPTTAYVWPARSRLVVETAPPVDAADTDPTHLDRANQVRIYVREAASTFKLQATVTAAPWRKALEGVAAGAAPRTDIPFAAGAVGTIQSTGQLFGGPAWRLVGDGMGNLPGMAWTAAGVVTLSGSLRDQIDARVFAVGDYYQATASADGTATSTANVAVPGLSQVVVVPSTAAVYRVDVDADQQIDTAGATAIAELTTGTSTIAVQGNPVVLSGPLNLRANGHRTLYVTGLAAGSQTFAVRARSGAAATTTRVRVGSTLSIQRVK